MRTPHAAYRFTDKEREQILRLSKKLAMTQTGVLRLALKRLARSVK